MLDLTLLKSAVVYIEPLTQLQLLVRLTQKMVILVCEYLYPRDVWVCPELPTSRDDIYMSRMPNLTHILEKLAVTM